MRDNSSYKKNGVLILFSGGMDSIAATVLLASEFSRIRLLTCNPPYVLGCRSLTADTIRKLRQQFPDVEITQTFESNLPLLRELHPGRAVREIRSSLGLCTACKLSIHLRAIEVCRRKGLHHASSGIGVLDQQKFPDQLPELEVRVNRLYAEAGIERLSPLDGRTKAEVKELLEPLGLFPKLRIPRCLAKHFQELWWFYFGWAKDERILAWYDSQLLLLEKKLRDMGSADA